MCWKFVTQKRKTEGIVIFVPLPTRLKTLKKAKAAAWLKFGKGGQKEMATRRKLKWMKSRH